MPSSPSVAIKSTGSEVSRAQFAQLYNGNSKTYPWAGSRETDRREPAPKAASAEGKSQSPKVTYSAILFRLHFGKWPHFNNVGQMRHCRRLGRLDGVELGCGSKATIAESLGVMEMFCVLMGWRPQSPVTKLYRTQDMCPRGGLEARGSGDALA